MAETDDNSSTSDDDWMLLCDALALVTPHARTEPAAAQLLLDYYAETRRPYGYRFQSVDKGSSRPGRGDRSGELARF